MCVSIYIFRCESMKLCTSLFWFVKGSFACGDVSNPLPRPGQGHQGHQVRYFLKQWITPMLDFKKIKKKHVCSLVIPMLVWCFNIWLLTSRFSVSCLASAGAPRDHDFMGPEFTNDGMSSSEKMGFIELPRKHAATCPQFGRNWWVIARAPMSRSVIYILHLWA